MWGQIKLIKRKREEGKEGEISWWLKESELQLIFTETKRERKRWEKIGRVRESC